MHERLKTATPVGRAILSNFRVDEIMIVDLIETSQKRLKTRGKNSKETQKSQNGGMDGQNYTDCITLLH